MPKKKHFWQLIDQMAEERTGDDSASWTSDAVTISAYVTTHGHIMTVDDVASELRHFVPQRSRWRVEHLGRNAFGFSLRRRSSAA